MTPEEYEEVSTRFQEANKKVNVARRLAEQEPSEENDAALREARMDFYEMKEEHDAAYAEHIAALPDSSTEKVLDDGTRAPLTKKDGS